MNRRRDTSIGGHDGTFHQTHWTQILAARTDDSGRKRRAIGAVLGRYWKPVYCYLRRKGCDNEEAKDLTQGFFQQVVLGRDLFRRADRRKGRFRNLLLTALDHYIVDVHRAETAGKPMPAGGLLSLDGLEQGEPRVSGDVTPEQAFVHGWAAELLGDVLREVEAGCARDGLAAHWEAFRLRVLLPIAEGAAPRSIPELCKDLGLAGEKRPSNMVITVKRRFQVAIRAVVREMVDSDEQVDDEIRALMQILSAGGAG